MWGPISDALGRRLPLFIGMVLFIIGSAGCALSTDIHQIVFWRVFQAFGACTGPMLARAMIRDLFSRTRAAQMLSTLIFYYGDCADCRTAGGRANHTLHQLARHLLAVGADRRADVPVAVRPAGNPERGKAGESLVTRRVSQLLRAVE